MPRTNRKGELFSHITKIGYFQDTAGGMSSTATGTLPAADSLGVLNVVSGSNGAIGDWFRVRALDNSPEINQIGGITVNAITPKYRHAIAPLTGDPVVEQSQVDLGHIAAGTVRLTLSGTDTKVRSEIRRRSIGKLLGNLKWSLEFGVLGHNFENLLTALGMLDTSANITGAGTSGDPYKTFINGEAIKERNDLCWFVEGVLKDGTTCIIQVWGCEVDYSAMTSKRARGQATVFPIKLIPTGRVRVIQYL